MLGYDTKNLKGDISGGLIAGIIALPLALAFGVQSGLGAAAGLYGAIAVGIFAAMFGGTPTQASGPTGPMTVVSASIVLFAIDAAGSIEAGIGIVLLSFLLGGVFQIVFGFLGVGKYIRYFPYPVVSGFMSGVGLIIIFLQLWPLLGSASPKSTIAVFTKIAEPLSVINWWAVGLGVLTLVVNYTFPKITKKVPSVLVALVVGTVVALLLKLDVPTIGDIPSGFPPLRIGSFLNVASEHYVFIMCNPESRWHCWDRSIRLLTAVIADNVTKDRHDSNRELIGQGIGNVDCVVFRWHSGSRGNQGNRCRHQRGRKNSPVGNHSWFIPTDCAPWRGRSGGSYPTQRSGRTFDLGRHRHHRLSVASSLEACSASGRGGDAGCSGLDRVWKSDSRGGGRRCACQHPVHETSE